MQNGSSRLLAAFVAVLLAAGCGSRGGSTPATVRVLYSSNTQGYVEPCG